MSIRWYLLGEDSHPVVSPISGERIVIHAPTKREAQAQAWNGYTVRSVLEHDAIQEEKNTQARREQQARAVMRRAQRVDASLREAATGQGDAFASADVKADIEAMTRKAGELVRALRGDLGEEAA